MAPPDGGPALGAEVAGAQVAGRSPWPLAMFRLSGPRPRPHLSRRQTMPVRQARRPATSGVLRPQAATHFDRIPPPHAWHQPANLPEILEHSPAPGLMTFCQFISGT